MRAALQQRQRAAADEIDLEAEEIVLRSSSADERLERRAADLEQPRDETADVRRHADEQVRQRQRGPRRVGRAAVRVPLGPERGIGRLDFFAESLVQRRETLGIVQIGERVAGNAGIQS